MCIIFLQFRFLNSIYCLNLRRLSFFDTLWQRIKIYLTLLKTSVILSTGT